jgi:hypothetical protein
MRAHLYWKASQYPELTDLRRCERLRIITAALAEHGKVARLRCCFAAIMVLAIIVGYGQFEDHLDGPWWVYWIVVFATAVTLYGYLLWEGNGPVRRAAQNYHANAS